MKAGKIVSILKKVGLNVKTFYKFFRGIVPYVRDLKEFREKEKTV
jgi:ACT domain-containing protein